MIYGIITGLIVGYIASLLQKGKGSGCLLNLVIGILGGWLGSFIFGLFGIESFSWLGDVITGIVGAVILLWILAKIKA